ncbi:peptidoglycan editing factor PgeF [Metabacillus sp. GX 13764]|uniref:peptidoglycan editing factor PgeF n=1 Tax=Metabacillus kandeliae TaxID=2900151 RepID=UPI001E4B087A|nr:peptidoglycan editing factor PgeF [Metabacillus kandeliae]MCD7033877.1 peptidoglycan editing factor PgeF [Metabacillus kandeliae]
MNPDAFQQQELTYMDIPLLNRVDSSVTAGFTLMDGGFSNGSYAELNMGLHVGDDPLAVQKNRNKLAEQLSMPLEQWVFADQVHDSIIYKAGSDDKGKGTLDYSTAIKGTDGLYTKEKNIMLALCFADCVPLFFFEKQQKLVGTAHAGWKGTVKNIAGRMVQEWTEKEQADPDRIIAVIGPSIGPCCYTVDSRVMDHVYSQNAAEPDKIYSEIKKGQFSLDLKELNRQLLIKAGLKDENIHVSSYCTGCESDLFFSHRRDNGKTGRMISFVGMKEEADTI